MVNLDSRIHLTKRILVVYEISGSHIITPPLSSYLKTPVFTVISLKKVAEDYGSKVEQEQLRRGPEVGEGKPGRV